METKSMKIVELVKVTNGKETISITKKHFDLISKKGWKMIDGKAAAEAAAAGKGKGK